METIADLLRRHGAALSDKPALVLLGDDNREVDRLTYGRLNELALHNGSRLAAVARPGSRAVLSFPTSLDLAVAFFACLHAQVIPVPVPSIQGRRYRRTVDGIVADCAAALLIGPDTSGGSEAGAGTQPAGGEPIRMAITRVPPAGAPAPNPPTVPDGTAYLQYTSGSTSAPKGVAVSHRNLTANLAMMTEAFGADETSDVVGWAPLYHDMGLVANLLHPLSRGSTSVLMSPGTFAAKPWLWLEAISHHRAAISGGPNYAYDLCIRRAGFALSRGIDLSCWTLAFNSAEPIRAGTIARFAEAFAPAGFRANAMYPCYGMAEATLLISGGDRDARPVVERVSRSHIAQGTAQPPRDGSDAVAVVGCGSALSGETICIVDPDDRSELEDGRVGEIWVAGPNIPEGYWERRDDRGDTYGATCSTRPGARFLRTGDLGFARNGELFFCGRLKDLIVIRGRNVYPQDIEYVSESSHPGLKPNSGAAFAVDRADGQDPMLVLVHEVERLERSSIDASACVSAIRQAVFQELGLTLGRVLLLKPGQVPKTSSGKNRRLQTKSMYLRNEFAAAVGMSAAEDALPALDQEGQ